MRIPALLHGEFAEVRKRCRKALTRWLREQRPLLEVFESEGMINTADHPGVIVVGGPNPLVSKYVHFHCYVPLRLLYPGIPQSLGPVGTVLEDAVFTALLERPWGMLCLLSSNNMTLWFARDEPHCYRRYLTAMMRHWDVLDAEGARYSEASSGGESLWSASGPVRQALARLGLPTEKLSDRVNLPIGGLPALVAQTDRTLAGDLVDVAASAASNRRARTHKPAATPPGFTEATLKSADYVFMSEQMEAALRANDAKLVERLVAAGEPIDTMDQEGTWSPLLWAAYHGHTALVRFLLDQGANIEDRWVEGESPLMVAAREGHRDMVRLLLDRGADPNYVTDKGWDVVQFAEMGGNPAVIAMVEPLNKGRTDEDETEE
jgi:hypothetical protein